uniref:hypothetical protein n=1 Tax=Xanthomonas campestris TaxID=339 RepID=UPI0028527701|nr:hypothetical protein [Xanthomonas campestris]
MLESVPEPTVAPSGQTLTNTKAYEALAQQSDIQALKQAQQTGGTAMPMPRPGQAAAEAKGEVTIDGTGVNMNAVPEPAAAAATTAQAQSAEATARLQQHEQQVQARYAIMSKQYDNLVGRWISVQTPVSVAVNQERKAGEAEDAQVGSASVASTASDDMAETTSGALLRANDTYLGITLGDATTDDRLPLVRARILNGPGKGSVMRGTIETSEFAPGGFIHFTSLTPPSVAQKRDAVEIDAVAIDPTTSRASVGDVNRHTASRMASLFFSWDRRSQESRRLCQLHGATPGASYRHHELHGATSTSTTHWCRGRGAGGNRVAPCNRLSGP